MRFLLCCAALLSIAVTMPGCGGGVLGAVAGGDLVDTFLGRAEKLSDRGLEGLAKAEAFLLEKSHRLALAKCRFSYTALVRYGCESDANAAAVESDCGLVLRCAAGRVKGPPE